MSLQTLDWNSREINEESYFMIYLKYQITAPYTLQCRYTIDLGSGIWDLGSARCTCVLVRFLRQNFKKTWWSIKPKTECIQYVYIISGVFCRTQFIVIFTNFTLHFEKFKKEKLRLHTEIDYYLLQTKLETGARWKKSKYQPNSLVWQPNRDCFLL